MDTAPTLPLFRLGAIPHFPGGGPVFCVPTRAVDTRAGKALAACSNARDGRLVLDTEAGARWIARRGDTDRDHTPDAAFEGRARHGETFHLFAWEDGSLAVAAPHGKRLLALPCILQTPTPLHLGALGARWGLEWEAGQGTLVAHKRRTTTSRKGRARHHNEATAFLPEVAADGPDRRAAAIVRAALLQAMSDLASRIADQPPVLWPVTATPRPGWTIPTFAAAGAPRWAGKGLAQLAHKAVFPAVARALVAQHLATNARPIKIFVHHTMPTGLGALEPPRLELSHSSEQAFASLALYKAFAQEAKDIFAQAWHQGRLGSVWPWCSTSEPAIEVVFEPDGLSRHAILAALAPQHTPSKTRAPTATRAPQPEPWWVGMVDDAQDSL
jgi:hypothetical protein